MPSSDNGLKISASHPPLEVLDARLTASFILPPTPTWVWIIALNKSFLKTQQDGRALEPLYRLRWALSRLWDGCRPILGSILLVNLETLLALALVRG